MAHGLEEANQIRPGNAECFGVDVGVKQQSLTSQFPINQNCDLVFLVVDDAKRGDAARRQAEDCQQLITAGKGQRFYAGGRCQ